MRNRIQMMMALGVCVFASAQALAAPPRVSFKTIKRHDINLKTKSPTFYNESLPYAVNRNKHTYIGRGLWQEQHWIYLMDNTTGRKIAVASPLPAFAASGRSPFVAVSGARSRFPYAVQRLLCYDEQHKIAGLAVKGPYSRAGQKSFYLHWDLRQNRITRADPLGATGPSSFWMSIKHIGYDPRRKECLFEVVQGPPRGASTSRLPVRIMAASAKRTRTVATLRTGRHVYGSPYYDPKNYRVLVAEYAENPLRGKRAPRGYLVNLKTRKVVRMTIPVTAYGVTFSDDGKTVYAYGTQTGEVWKINAATGRRTRKVAHGKLGHGLSFAFKDTLLLLLNKAMVFLDPGTLARRQTIPFRRVYKDWSHVQGSFVVPGKVIVKNGWKLYLLHLRKRP